MFSNVISLMRNMNVIHESGNFGVSILKPMPMTIRLTKLFF